MTSYKIHRIFNNAESDRVYEAALSGEADFLVLGKTTLPDLGQGSQPPINGSFEVYEIIYGPGKQIQEINQIGNTVTGLTDELLGAKVGCSYDGDIILASSAITGFRLYSQNSLSGIWEETFAPSASVNPLNIGGFRYCRNLHNIVSAHVGSMGETELFYYRKNGSTYETPSYASSQPFKDMFSAIRGLSISCEVALTSGTGPIIAHLQMGTQQDYATLHILELGDTSYTTRGTITTFDNNPNHLGLNVYISSNGQCLAVTSYKEFDLYVELFKYNAGTWDSIKQMTLTRDTNEFTFSYIYLSDVFDTTYPDFPKKFLLSGVNGLAQDSIYGVYEFDATSQSYIQKFSLLDKLTTLTGSSVPKVGFSEAAVTYDVEVMYKSFLNFDGSNVIPMNYTVNPEFDIDVDNVNSTGIAGMLLVNSTQAVAVNAGHYTIPGPYIFDLAEDDTFEQYLIDNSLTVVSYSTNFSSYTVHPTTGVVTIAGGSGIGGGSFTSHLDGILVTTTTSPFYVELSGSWDISPEPEAEEEPESEAEPEEETEPEAEPEEETEPEAEPEEETEPEESDDESEDEETVIPPPQSVLFRALVAIWNFIKNHLVLTTMSIISMVGIIILVISGVIYLI